MIRGAAGSTRSQSTKAMRLPTESIPVMPLVGAKHRMRDLEDTGRFDPREMAGDMVSTRVRVSGGSRNGASVFIGKS